MYRHAAFALIAFTALVLSACDDSTGITAEEIACPTTPTLTYANFGAAVIEANCLECHASRERPHLNTQAEVGAESASIIAAAVYHSSMPDGGAMTNELRIQLGQWLTCGAP